MSYRELSTILMIIKVVIEKRRWSDKGTEYAQIRFGVGPGNHEFAGHFV